LIEALGLTNENVTIINPPQPIDPTSSVDLWRKMDAIPPSAVFGVLTDTKEFSSEYRSILNNLNPQIDDSALRSILTDDYPGWVKFQKDNPGTVKYKTIVDKFEAFADTEGIDGFKAGKAEAVLRKLGEDPLTIALDALNKDKSPENYLNGNLIYIPDIDTLKNSIRSSTSLTFSFENSEFSSSTDSFWSSNFYSGGLFDWFSSGSNISSQTLQKIHNAKIEVTVTFDNFARSTVDRGLWYKSNMMTTAYETKDNTVWGHESPSWDNEFGPNGTFTRVTTNIIVVDGVHISATISNSDFSSQDASNVQTAVKHGFWPFFGDSTSTNTWTNHSDTSQGSTFTVTSESVKGNPQYLGIIHESAKVAFGGGN
jgi:hypothetical protein